MAVTYAYFYARINTTNGMCVGLKDTSNYILSNDHVPIDVYDENYLMKYYWPLPETVTSFDDFQGQWYSDAAHTTPWSPA